MGILRRDLAALPRAERKALRAIVDAPADQLTPEQMAALLAFDAARGGTGRNSS